MIVINEFRNTKAAKFCQLIILEYRIPIYMYFYISIRIYVCVYIVYKINSNTKNNNF